MGEKYIFFVQRKVNPVELFYIFLNSLFIYFINAAKWWIWLVIAAAVLAALPFLCFKYHLIQRKIKEGNFLYQTQLSKHFANRLLKTNSSLLYLPFLTIGKG